MSPTRRSAIAGPSEASRAQAEPSRFVYLCGRAELGEELKAGRAGCYTCGPQYPFQRRVDLREQTAGGDC